MFGDMKPLAEDEYWQVYKITGLDLDGRREMVEKHKIRYEAWYQNYIQFVKSIPAFLELPTEDQVAMLKGTGP